MNSSIKRVIFFACIVVLSFTACKKDRSPKGPVPADDYIETEAPIIKGVGAKVNAATNGYYETLPSYYGQTTKSYPLLITLHGAGQNGNGGNQLPNLLNDGVPKLIAAHTFPPNFVVNGKNYSFIVLSPQFSRYPGEDEIQSFITYVKKKYRIDAARIYITGLSMGGYVASDMGAKYTSELAAVVPMSGVSEAGDLNAKAANIAKGKLPTWYFNNNNDPTVPVANTIKFVNLINGNNPVIQAKSTIFDQSGHDSWSKAIDPAYKENNMNIYEWMLQYSR